MSTILSEEEMEQEDLAKGQNVPGINSIENTTDNSSKKQPSRSEQRVANRAEKRMRYDEMIKALQGGGEYKTPSEEQLEWERKRKKRAQIFAAIGDGLSALSNLWATTQGAPSAYDGKNTISGAINSKYEKLNAIRAGKENEFYNRAQAEEDKNYRRGIDKANMEFRKSQAQAEEERHRENIKLKTDAATQAQKNWEQGQQNAEKRHKETLEYQRQRDEKNRRSQEKIATEKAEANGRKAVRGNEIVFSDGTANKVKVWGNVWKGSMPSVYNAIIEDNPELLPPLVRNGVEKLSRQQMETFVQENWHKSKSAKQIMKTLSTLDPDAMTSEISEEEEDDFSEYEIK